MPKSLYPTPEKKKPPIVPPMVWFWIVFIVIFILVIIIAYTSIFAYFYNAPLA